MPNTSPPHILRANSFSLPTGILRRFAGLGVGFALLATSAHIAHAASTLASNAPDLSAIETIVVIFAENRSVDNL